MRRALAVLALLLVGEALAGAPRPIPRDIHKLKAWERNRLNSESGGSSGGTVLRILSPPGTGYDATNVALYTSTGAPVTVTRASSVFCGQVGTTFTVPSSNQPCLENGALRAEPAHTNVLLRSAEIDHASWTNLGTPTVTANTWDFGLGATGETINDPDAADNGRTQSVATVTTGAWTGSCSMQSGNTTNARMTITVTGGTGTATCAISGLTTTTSRQTCTVTAGAGVSAVAMTLLVGASAAGSGNVKYGGCQLETGSIANSYFGTTTAAAGSAAQTATAAMPAAMSRTEGCLRACITPNWTGSAPDAMSAVIVHTAAACGAGAVGYIATDGAFKAYDGTNNPAIAAGLVAGVRSCFRTSWSATRNAFRVENLQSGASNSTAFTTLPAFSTAQLGSCGTETLRGLIDSVDLDNNPDGCR